MRRQIFCWDVDGVLIKYDPDDPANDWRKVLLAGRLLDQWEAFQRSGAWRTCLRDCHTNTIAALAGFLAGHGGDPRQAAYMVNVWLSGNTESNPRSLALLKQIRNCGYESVIISNQEGLRAAWLDRWLAGNGLRDIPRFISCRIGAIKPDPVFFHAIQVTMGCDASRLYLFDDKQENVEAALFAGWSGQLVRPGIPVISPLAA